MYNLLIGKYYFTFELKMVILIEFLLRIED